MKIKRAKETVVLAGRKLVESGLIVRTWGNVSCRVNDSSFVVTPSGRDYLSLTPDKIVEVAISDCSYSGDIKPSSEKGIHAEVYKLHPEVNFVIHTHQNMASLVSVLDRNSIKVPDEFKSLCGEVVCAGYGLPGTKKLRKNVVKALKFSKGKAVIMKNHGALCFGKDLDEAFNVAQELEAACESFIKNNFGDKLNIKQLGCFALSKLTLKDVMEDEIDDTLYYESERTKDGFKMHIGDKDYDVIAGALLSNVPTDDRIALEASIHYKLYKDHQNINNIIHANTPGILDVSKMGIKLFPVLDDYAQIAGTSVKTVESDMQKISDALKKSSAVFIQRYGALCCGASKEDALALNIVVEKNCKAFLVAALAGRVKYINHLDAALMRFVYVKKYSKQAYIK